MKTKTNKEQTTTDKLVLASLPTLNAYRHASTIATEIDRSEEDVSASLNRLLSADLAHPVYADGKTFWTARSTVSPIYTLFAHAWQHSEVATGHSWQRLNSSLRQLMLWAVATGFKFRESDVVDVLDRFRGGYWADVEGWYSCAVASKNISACKSLEAAMDRPAFVFDGVRLALDSQVFFEGTHMRVTSFADDKQSLLLCASAYNVETKKTSVTKRRRVTLDEFRSLEKARKAATK